MEQFYILSPDLLKITKKECFEIEIAETGIRRALTILRDRSCFLFKLIDMSTIFIKNKDEFYIFYNLPLKTIHKLPTQESSEAAFLYIDSS